MDGRLEDVAVTGYSTPNNSQGKHSLALQLFQTSQHRYRRPYLDAS